ncbi:MULTISPECIES: helix-turn-helix domain-containing protein [Chitinophaga]|uniref:helix-turn-helix domain-containing protein n=1 Tax=Chitinophaga TaxID=79328 RepID=UPI00115B267E|nr:helix-turn-helix domain-containing protein [Chitinophaga polysaccharea]
MEAIIEKTNKKDQKLAKSFLMELQETFQMIIKTKRESVTIRIDDTKGTRQIPKKAFALLYNILDLMAEGKSVTLFPSDAEISTQEAADLLNVSRPYVVSLLKKGDIPFTKVGTHRRILLSDIIAYDKQLQKNRNSKLNFLAKQAQELNLGYE